MFDKELIESAMADAERLHAEMPEIATLSSVVAQLRYLLAIAEDPDHDRSRIGEIVLGVQAAREIEPLNESLANKLHTIDYQARSLASA